MSSFIPDAYYKSVFDINYDKLSNKGIKVLFFDFDNITYGLENADIFSGSKTAYARLFLPNIIEDDRLLYLDCDTLVNGSLTDLWNLNMDNAYVAGVQDMVVPHIRTGIGLTHSDVYLNSGVLLMNIRKMQCDNLQQKFVAYIEEMNGSVPCHDQGVINHVCAGYIKVLPAEFNVMTPMMYHSADEIRRFYELEQFYTNNEMKEACRNPKVIHFTAGWYVRPWFSGSKHPYAKIYKEYYNQSPWGTKPMAKGTVHKKIRLMRLMYKILPFGLYVEIAKWKRKH